jgi:hypothetical protein
MKTFVKTHRSSLVWIVVGFLLFGPLGALIGGGLYAWRNDRKSKKVRNAVRV